VKISGQHYRTIFLDDDGWSVRVIDQTKLPFELDLARLTSLAETADAITSMIVRGAPLIGATAAYGVALALHGDASNATLESAIQTLAATRPTAVNLGWALARMRRVLAPLSPDERVARAYVEAAAISDEDVKCCAAIGRHGVELIRTLARGKPGKVVNVLTHCNAGWLACVDWGTALAPVYAAHDAGISVHVFVDETRPRNQGAALTAFELGAHGVPHTVVVDNAGGHLMQRAQIDLCIVGSDRVTATGDVANKIGTYLKALAARDNAVPFYAAFPFSTIDWGLSDGVREIPIEERASHEVTHVRGMTDGGRLECVRVVAPTSIALNPAFDVTPAHLVTGLITERGIAQASRAGLELLYPERH
jgi:methylthioribose-1-phosphate isomerase